MPDLSEALKSGMFSDLIIKCKDKTFAVHKSIVCAQSGVLLAAVSHDFKEAITGIIDLSEYDVEFIRVFVRFLYSGSYDFNGAAAKCHETAFHVSMYALGDKYDIPHLKAFAKTKLAPALDSACTGHKALLGAIKLIHENTPETDRKIREIVVRSVRARLRDIVKDATAKNQLTELFQTTPEFGIDILKDFTEVPALLKCSSCGPHQPQVHIKIQCATCGKTQPNSFSGLY